jgi:MOSC domain-containing protein YiiM
MGENSAAMQVVSLNLSQGETQMWQGRRVESGIFKKSVSRRVRVHRMGIEGDHVADLTVHGGEHKAVYAYALEHYDFWNRELGRELAHGAFGENLTIRNFPEDDVCVGDTFTVGEAVLQAVQPRLPCFKLGMRFEDPGMIRRFVNAARWGVYFRVVKEGTVAAGDAVKRLERDAGRFPLGDIALLAVASEKDPAMLRRALAIPALPPNWRNDFSEWLGGPF